MYEHYSNLLGVLVGSVVMMFACYNGASFYIDVFSQRYHFEKVLKIPASQKPTGQTGLYAHKNN